MGGIVWVGVWWGMCGWECVGGIVCGWEVGERDKKGERERVLQLVHHWRSIVRIDTGNFSLVALQAATKSRSDKFDSTKVILV